MKREDKWEYKGDIFLGDIVMCSDPCYVDGTWCQIKVDDVCNGKYCCYLSMCEKRCKAIKLIHSDYKSDNSFKFVEYEGEIGVDSGQAGVFGYDYFVSTRNGDNSDVDEEWYKEVCNLTSMNIQNPEYVPFECSKLFKLFLDFMFLEDESVNRMLYDEIHNLFYDEDADNMISMLNCHFSSDKIKKYDEEFIKDIQEAKEIYFSLSGCDDSSDKYKASLESIYEVLDCTRLFTATVMRSLEVMYRYSLPGCRDILVSTANQIDCKGFVSSSGYGDGEYYLKVSRNKSGKVIGFIIEFI